MVNKPKKTGGRFLTIILKIAKIFKSRDIEALPNREIASQTPLPEAQNDPQIPEKLPMSVAMPPAEAEVKTRFIDLTCPYCGSQKAVKRGTRQKKLEKVQLYLCSGCSRTFTPGATKGKHYPMSTIIDAISLYNLGFSLEQAGKAASLLANRPAAVVARPSGSMSQGGPDSTSGNIGTGTGNIGSGTECVTGDTKLCRLKNCNKVNEVVWEELPIKDIQVGDEVLTLEEKSGQFVTSTVKGSMDKGVQAVFELTTESGKKIETTANHPYLVKNLKVDGENSWEFLDSNFIYDYGFEAIRDITKKFYFTVLVKWAPMVSALENDLVEFTDVGWDHLDSGGRKKSDVIFRFFALPKVIAVLQDKGANIAHSIGRDINSRVEFWAITANVDGVNVKVVLRSINSGAKHFYSIVWKGDLSNKKGAVSRLNPRRQGMITLQLQENISRFVQDLSRENKKEPSLLYQDECGVSRGLESTSWTKVRRLKPGMLIAVAAITSEPKLFRVLELVFEKIVSIVSTGCKQTYDIEVEGTRNFVGNGIVAHNTYLPAADRPIPEVARPSGNMSQGEPGGPGDMLATEGNIGSGTVECVTGDTKLRCFRGGKVDDSWQAVSIKDIQTGDEILTLDEKSGLFVTSTVQSPMDKGMQLVYGLRTASGKYIKTTGNHPYLAQSELIKNVTGTFEVDISGRVEEMNKDSFVALANEQASFVLALPAREKRLLKNFHQKNRHTKFGFQVYAHLIVQALKLSGFNVLGLKIDHDYAGSEAEVASIISITHTDLPMSFVKVGKASPAHRAAYIANTKGIGVDKNLTVAEYLANKNEIQVALKGTADATDHQEWIPGFPAHKISRLAYQTGGDLSTISRWIKVLQLNPGAKIATVDGWEYIVSIDRLGSRHTYDVEVEKTHNFVGNGIVAHNTYLPIPEVARPIPNVALPSGNMSQGGQGDMMATDGNVGSGTIGTGTLLTWLDQYKDFITYTRMRPYAIKMFRPQDVLIRATLAHRQLYRFRYHRAKTILLLREDMKHKSFWPLKEFLDLVAVECPHQYFQEGTRASEAPITFSKKEMIVRAKQNYANTVTKFVLESVERSKDRHDALQRFMLANDSVTVATEVPVYIRREDLAHMQTQLGFEVYSRPSADVARTSGSISQLGLDSTKGNIGTGTECVTGDTMLHCLKNNKTTGGVAWEDISIKDIQTGDEILTLDEENGEFIPAKVIQLMDKGVQKTLRLVTVSGKTIETTGNHPYLVRENKPLLKSRRLSTYEVDQSNRIEELNKDTYIALANAFNSVVIKISREVKREIVAGFLGNPKLFAPTLFAMGIVELIRQSELVVTDLVLDTEYVGYEMMMADIIRRNGAEISVRVQSIGKSSSAHLAAYSANKKRKVMANSSLKGGLASELLHFEFTKIRSPHYLLFFRDYAKDGKMSSVGLKVKGEVTSWQKVENLRPGMVIATLDGWEKIAKVYPIGKKSVYDVAVEGTRNFIGNGIVAHNTYHPAADIADSSGSLSQGDMLATDGNVGSGTLPKLITGHIDMIQIRNGYIHIMDYKPKAAKERPIEQLTIYALALSRLTGLRVFNFKCAWFDEKDYFEFFPLHVVYKPKQKRRSRKVSTMEGVYAINENPKRLDNIRPAADIALPFGSKSHKLKV